MAERLVKTFIGIEERNNFNDISVVEEVIYDEIDGKGIPSVAEFYQGETDDLFMLRAISRKNRRKNLPDCFDYEIMPVNTDESRQMISTVRTAFSSIRVEFRNDTVIQSFSTSLREIKEFNRIGFFVIKNKIPVESGGVFNIQTISNMLKESETWKAVFVHSDSGVVLNVDRKKTTDGNWTIYWNNM